MTSASSRARDLIDAFEADRINAPSDPANGHAIGVTPVKDELLAYIAGLEAIIRHDPEPPIEPGTVSVTKTIRARGFMAKPAKDGRVWLDLYSPSDKSVTVLSIDPDDAIRLIEDARPPVAPHGDGDAGVPEREGE